jgi:4-hydroxy-tetrahydrodipicolinate synthase
MYEPRGSWVAVPTPFRAEDESIDFDVFRQIVDLHADNGTSALLVMGSAGEPTHLGSDERRRIIDEIARYTRGKLPVFFGTTAGSTRETIALSRYAEDKGADGIVLVVPPYTTPPQEDIFEHFLAVAQSVTLPVALYNNPTRVKVNIDPPTIARLNREAPNVFIDKEAMADVSQLADVMAMSEGRVKVMCCDYPKYGLVMPTLALGGVGTANITGNVAPAEMAELSEPWTNGTDIESKRALFFRLLPLMKAMYWITNPVVQKAGYEILGIPVGRPRRPLKPLPAAMHRRLESIMNELGLPERYAPWARRPVLAAAR